MSKKFNNTLSNESVDIDTIKNKKLEQPLDEKDTPINVVKELINQDNIEVTTKDNIEDSESDIVINALLKNTTFPNQIMIRANRDIRLEEEYHITQIVGIECSYLVGYVPPDSFIGNIAFTILKKLYEYDKDLFRNKLKNKAKIISRASQAMLKQEQIDIALNEFVDELLKKIHRN